MGFNLLTESACASVTRVVDLIPHTSMASIIHGTPMKILIYPSPCLLPMSFKKMVAASVSVPQVTSNNGGGTKSPPPINYGT